MLEKINEKVEKPAHHKELCNVCGSRYHPSGRARHLRTKKHKDADYINNKIFEIKKIKYKP
jgi:response regulator RpfG family c-di-GMP phosphodiesterase